MLLNTKIQLNISQYAILILLSIVNDNSFGSRKNITNPVVMMA